MSMRKLILFFGGCCFRLLSLHAQTITYATVQPIFVNKCVPCHRSGDAAPFSLSSYEDARKRMAFIKDVITRGYMPPWKADPHYREFADTRSLTPEEKRLLIQWIDEGGWEGKGKDPAGANKTDNMELRKTTTYFRKPDLTLKIDSFYKVAGDNVEKFIDFKIPFELGSEQNVEAIEFYTNNKKIIHHANYGFYEVTGKRMIYYTGWIPGASVESYPKGFGWVLPRRGVIKLTVHYTANAADEQSVVGVNLFFRKDSIRRSIEIISLGSGGIAENDISPPLFIPRNQVCTFHLRVKTKDEQSLLYVWPHMHLLGKEFYSYAVTPDNDTIPLVHIPNWDFRWQELYKFKQLIRIPKGSVINMDCTYDNTANNPFNPNSPPKGVFSLGDMSANNEMMTLLLIYVPYREGDEKLKLEE